MKKRWMRYWRFRGLRSTAVATAYWRLSRGNHDTHEPDWKRRKQAKRERWTMRDALASEAGIYSKRRYFLIVRPREWFETPVFETARLRECAGIFLLWEMIWWMWGKPSRRPYELYRWAHSSDRASSSDKALATPSEHWRLRRLKVESSWMREGCEAFCEPLVGTVEELRNERSASAVRMPRLVNKEQWPTQQSDGCTWHPIFPIPK